MANELNEKTSRAELIALIAAAFAGVSRDGGITLQEARAKDDYATPAEQFAARSRDTESHWDEIPEEKLVEYHDVHAFLDAKGLRFYLPAFMTSIVRELGDMSKYSDSTIFALDPGETTETWYSFQMERFGILTDTQSKAICRFLTYISEFRNDSSARRALRRYWNRFSDSRG